MSPAMWTTILEKMKGVGATWSVYTALGSFVLYFLGYLVLRFQLATWGVIADLSVLDERYFFAGARFVVYLVTSTVNALLLAFPLFLAWWLLKRSLRFQAWRKAANTATAGVIFAVLFIQLVERKCFQLMNGLLVQPQLDGDAWLKAILRNESSDSLFFAGLMMGVAITGWLLGAYGWRQMLILEGLLPFVWLPVWWFCIRDHPREAKWISAEEKKFLEVTLTKEAEDRKSVQTFSWFARLAHPSVFVMVALYFLHNCAAYGCMTFFTNCLKDQGFDALQYGILFAVPYAITALVMVLNSWHSDKTGERRGHVAAVYFMSGTSLILSVLLSGHFWISYALLCLAIPGPFAAMAPFWAIPGETLPRNVMGVVMGLVNAFGNLGGFAGPYIVGWLLKEYQSTALAFNALGAGMLTCAALAFMLPNSAQARRATVSTVK